MKKLKIVLFSALNAVQIGFNFFVFAFIVSFCLSGIIDADKISLFPLVIMSSFFGFIGFSIFCPFCYMEAKKGKSYPFIKMDIWDILFGII